MGDRRWRRAHRASESRPDISARHLLRAFRHLLPMMRVPIDQHERPEIGQAVAERREIRMERKDHLRR